MTYKQIKWVIILGPMFIIEIWELARHKYLYSYISMDFGNWLSALIVLGVTFILTTKLFLKMEHMQGELQRARSEKAILLERERIARELHDGIAQSLFLLSVKMNKLEESTPTSHYDALKETIRRVHDDVRQAISNLRLPPTVESTPWFQTINAEIQTFENETGIPVSLEWESTGDMEQHLLSAKDKIEITSSLREALMNIRKHAKAHHVWVCFTTKNKGWYMLVEDDGKGFEGDPFVVSSRYGLRMMRERAEEMGWRFKIERVNHRTRIKIRKER